jgi:hypothetical protein
MKSKYLYNLCFSFKCDYNFPRQLLCYSSVRAILFSFHTFVLNLTHGKNGSHTKAKFLLNQKDISMKGFFVGSKSFVQAFFHVTVTFEGSSVNILISYVCNLVC